MSTGGAVPKNKNLKSASTFEMRNLQELRERQDKFHDFGAEHCGRGEHSFELQPKPKSLCIPQNGIKKNSAELEKSKSMTAAKKTDYQEKTWSVLYIAAKNNAQKLHMEH